MRYSEQRRVRIFAHVHFVAYTQFLVCADKIDYIDYLVGIYRQTSRDLYTVVTLFRDGMFQRDIIFTFGAKGIEYLARKVFTRIFARVFLKIGLQTAEIIGKFLFEAVIFTARPRIARRNVNAFTREHIEKFGRALRNAFRCLV